MDQNLDDKTQESEQPLLENWAGGTVLSRQQVNQAIMDIEDIHPLRESSTFDSIYPKLQFCRKYSCCKPKPNFKFGLRKTLLKEMTLKIPSSETQLQEDPFLVLGYGANAYFQIIESLFNMALFITIVMIPVMIVYSNNKINGLKEVPNYKLNKLSLGNFGASTVSCNVKRLGHGAMDFSCPFGIIDVKNPEIGVMNTGLKAMVYCTEKAIWSDASNIEPKKTCSSYMDKTKMYQRIIESCYNKKECTVETDNWYKEDTPSDIKNVDSKTNLCNNNAVMYIQMPCLIPQDQKIDRQIFGLFCGCIICFIYLFSIVYFDYVMTVQKNLYVDWDVKTITAGDYSTEHNIDSEAYERWQTKYLDECNPMSEIGQFKVYLQEILEQRINNMKDCGYDPEDERDYYKQVAQISFAYDNSEVIGWLKERGDHLRNEQWEKVKHTQAHIKHELTKKTNTQSRDSSLLDQLQTPVTAFVTWVTEEGLNRALSWNEDYPQCKVLGQDIEIKPASEPTDIIWENRHYKQSQRNKRKILVLFLICVIISISGIIISSFQVMSNTAKNKFPVRGCLSYFEQYYGKKGGMKNWEGQAVKSYVLNQAYKKNHLKEHYDGNMECFCKNQTSKDQNKEFTYTLPNKNVVSHRICSYYNHEMMISQMFAESIPFLIIITNYILKVATIALIKWVGEDTLSEQMTSIANFVFAAYFFNTGILLVLINANLTEHWPYSLTQFVDGAYYDYTPNWYANVGELLVETMLIQACLPYLTVIVGMGKPWLMRRLDNSFTNDPYKTKQTAMSQYKDLYSGQEYVLHYKSAMIINVTWITMMYGIGLPILFPIAAFSYFNSYICERIIVSFQVKLPPATDNTLTNNLISKCKYAPLLMLMNGYWMLSNPEIFENKWNYVPTILNTHMKSKHFLSIDVNWAFPVLLLALASIFILLSQKFFGESLSALGYGMQRKEIQVDEDLPPFFEAVRLSQADEIIAEEMNMQNNFGFLIQDPDTIIELEKVLYPKQSCLGTPWYNILSNPGYSSQFNYIGAFIQDREYLIEDGHEDEVDHHGVMNKEQIASRCEQSDFIIVLLNLSCIPDEVIRKIDFMPGWQKRFKQHMNNYKVKWTERTKNKVVDKWQYQCPEIEDLYREHIKKAEKDDEDLQDDLQEQEAKLNALEEEEMKLQKKVDEKDDDFKKAEDEDDKEEEKQEGGEQDDFYQRMH